MVTAQVMPEVFDGVEFRAVRRQRDQREVGRWPQLVGGMEPGLVPEHHHMHVGIDFFDELLEEGVDDIGVQVRREQADGLAGLGAGGSEHIEVVVTGLPDGWRSRAFASPFAGQRALLTEASLVLEPDLDPLVGVLIGNVLDERCGVFLKASTFAGSFFS